MLVVVSWSCHLPDVIITRRTPEISEVGGCVCSARPDFQTMLISSSVISFFDSTSNSCRALIYVTLGLGAARLFIFCLKHVFLNISPFKMTCFSIMKLMCLFNKEKICNHSSACFLGVWLLVGIHTSLPLFHAVRLNTDIISLAHLQQANQPKSQRSPVILSFRLIRAARLLSSPPHCFFINISILHRESK